MGRTRQIIYRVAALYVDKILKGRKACRPAHAAARPLSSLIINRAKAAKTLGLTLPANAARARRRGDRVSLLSLLHLLRSGIGTKLPQPIRRYVRCW